MADEEPSDIQSRDTSERKIVTLNSQPEIFTYSPDTVEVERQETPRSVSFSFPPSSAELSPEDVAEIIHETTDIIRFCEKKVLSQKLNGAKLGFMLIRIAESLHDYESIIKQLNSFLVNGDKVTGQYYTDVCGNLPTYGDYLKAIDDIAASSVTVGGIDGLVDKTGLEQFVREVQDNAFAGGMFLRSFRVMNKGINQSMQEGREITEHVTKQVEAWLKLKNAVAEQLDAMRDRLYKLSAYVDFVKSGETRMSFRNSFGGSSMSSRKNSSLMFEGSFGSVSTIKKPP